MEQLMINTGKVLASLKAEAGSVTEAEFKVFSQFGEDGILQWILHRVPVANRFFVEFGVESYKESNTRFLLLSGAGWSGLVMDGSEEYVSQIRAEPWFWRHHLTAAHAFITKDNINELLETHGASGDIGILSVDIDGNDLWVWDAITVCSPRIVVCEYNALFGPDRIVSMPYTPQFVVDRDEPSWLYWGASAAAFEFVGRSKGYRLVAGNAAGNNLFFVREDLAGAIPVLGAGDAWKPPQFRIERDADHKLSYRGWRDCMEALRGKQVMEWNGSNGSWATAGF